MREPILTQIFFSLCLGRWILFWSLFLSQLLLLLLLYHYYDYYCYCYSMSSPHTFLPIHKQAKVSCNLRELKIVRRNFTWPWYSSRLHLNLFLFQNTPNLMIIIFWKFPFNSLCFGFHLQNFVDTLLSCLVVLCKYVVVISFAFHLTLVIIDFPS